MNWLKIVVATVMVGLVSACGTSGTSSGNMVEESKVFDYKAPPAKAKQLDIPPELTAYVGDDRFAIPGEGESGTRYSEYIQGGNNRKSGNGVLPQAKNVRMERNASQRWLVVDDKPENVWPVVKAFWQENGLEFKIENPQAGVLETEWAENRAKIPMDSFRKMFGTVFESMMSSGEKDQYHTRIERSKDGKSTEIYIVHYGLQEVAAKDETGFRWVARPSDPELEATMLQLLMSKLAGGSGVLDQRQKPAESTLAAAANAPRLNKLADGSQTILLTEPFDKSWRKVGLALEQAGIVLADKDRSKGIYYLSAGKDELKSRQNSEKLQRMQVTVKELSAGCEVAVNNGAGAADAETQKVIETLFKILGRV